MYTDIVNSIIDGNMSETKSLVSKTLEKGDAAIEIINKEIVQGLDIVGEQVRNGEMFFPEMMMSSLAAQKGFEVAMQAIEEHDVKPRATIVLATVKGDVHDLGKKIVALVLKPRGFKILDLGVDVDEQTCLNAVREHQPEFLGLSCLMSTTIGSMKNILTELNASELRDTVKVLVGGCPVNQDYANQIGADGYARDASEAAILVERLLSEIKNQT